MNFSNSFTFEDYIKLATDEQRKEYEKAANNFKLSEETIDKLSNLNKEVNLVVFSENYCPDCIVTLPIIKKFQELNSNVKFYIFKKIGNEELLNDMVGENRIPTVVFFNDKLEPKSFYVEFPDEFKKMIVGLDEESRKKLIQEFREGRYSNLVENEIIEHIEKACC